MLELELEQLEGSLGEEGDESVKSKTCVPVFKYLGNNLQSNVDHGCRSEQEYTVWMEQLGEDVMVFCDKRIPPHVKGKTHKMIVQPAMLYRMETVPVTSSNVKKLVEMTEMKMWIWAGGHTVRDHVRNDTIRERLKEENTTQRGAGKIDRGGLDT